MQAAICRTPPRGVDALQPQMPEDA